MHRLSLILLSLSLLISACTTLPAVDTNWENHRNQVSALNNWELQGRINIRSESGSNSLNFNWQQQGENFSITLSAPFGLSTIKLEGNKQFVTIEKAGQEPMTANNLEEASRDHLGIEFPASALYYWIRGIPKPGLATQTSLENQLLQTLQQNDQQQRTWQLEYDRYQTIESISLPGRVKAQYSSYRLTFNIHRWQLNSV